MNRRSGSDLSQVQILSIIAKPQTPQVALELLAPYEDAHVRRSAAFVWSLTKGLLVHSIEVVVLICFK